MEKPFASARTGILFLIILALLLNVKPAGAQGD